MDAFRNLNLDSTKVEKKNDSFNFKDYENKFNFDNYDDGGEDDQSFGGILLSDELKNTLKQSKENSEYDLLRKLSNNELV